MSNIVPVKLLPAGANRTQLMKVIGEKTLKFNSSDYIERTAGNKTGGGPRERARTLLAIENASEIAKTYLHAPGMFEKIMTDTIGTRGYISYQIKETTNNINITRKTYPKDHYQDFILLTHKFQNRTGHTGLLHVEHQNGKVTVYDSMYGKGSKFENVAKNQFAASQWSTPRVRSIFGCKAKVRNLSDGTTAKLNVQPSGGFVNNSYNKFTNDPRNFGSVIRNLFGEKVAKGTFKLSQYDELSQHHFCYMEALYAMMLATYRDSRQAFAKNPGPNDPRKRISFIKKFIWGIIHKYTPKSERNTAEWKYFSKTFPYIMTTTSKTGKTLRLFRGTMQLPDNDGTFGVRTTAMSWKGYDKIDGSWSIEDVLNWVHTGRSPRGNRNANSNSNSNNNTNSNSNSNNNATRSFRRPTKNNMNSNNSNSNSNSNNNNNRKSNSNNNNRKNKT
jgi:hypothetical protein